MRIESCASLSSYPLMKGDDPMFHKRDVYAEHTFQKADPLSMATKFPVVIDSVNEDGTYQGHFDLDNMSTAKRILATLY